jgi:hypothetical protein
MLMDAYFDFEIYGQHAGIRSLFVETPGETEWTADDLRDFIKTEPTRFAVLRKSGGAVHNRDASILTDILKFQNFYITAYLTGDSTPLKNVDNIICRPTPNSNPPYAINRELWVFVREFNYLVGKGFDYGLLDRHDVKDGRRYSLTPDGDITSELEDYIKQNPRWRLGLHTENV